MNVIKRVARSVRGFNTEGSLQSFYGAIASSNPSGAPQYRESKRDYEAAHGGSNRYMLF